MPHAYTEDQLVEQPAIGLFAELGWQTVSAMEETFGVTGTLLRETKGEVVLASRLRAALERLNPTLPPEAITAAVDELTRDRSAMSLEAAKREVYRLLKEGIKVSVADTGADSTPRPGSLSSAPRPSPGLRPPSPAPAGEGDGRGGGQKTERAAFDENLTHYKAEIPQLFWFNALLIASNGMDSRVGSLTADWERFSTSRCAITRSCKPSPGRTGCSPASARATPGLDHEPHRGGPETGLMKMRRAAARPQAGQAARSAAPSGHTRPSRRSA